MRPCGECGRQETRTRLEAGLDGTSTVCLEAEGASRRADLRGVPRRTARRLRRRRHGVGLRERGTRATRGIRPARDR
jgi:hypothetical protein